MIIREISLQNFQCYFGSHQDNKLKFSNGVNLIVGNNGGGKSKLFDAFYWVIYNKIFQSDTRLFVPTSQYKESLISDKAKAQTQDGQTVSTEVTLSVFDSQDREYLVTRIYRAKKLSDKSWSGNQDSELLIYEIKNGTPQIMHKDKHESVLNRIIPGHLKPYMWFQGEQVDSLMDLKNKSSLMQTINMLSDISDYDHLIDVAKTAADKANKDLSKARKDKSKDVALSERLAREEGEHRAQIAQYTQEETDNEGAIANAKEGVDRLLSQLDDAKRKVELKANKKVAEEQRDIVNGELERRLKKLNGRLFSDHWLLRNVEPFAHKFLEKYKTYSNHHLEILTALKLSDNPLPVDMPPPVHVQKMLDEHVCFVCGRPAADGTDEYERIKSLLNREKPNVENAFQHDCSGFFEDLYENTIGLRHVVSKLDEAIPREFKEINTLRGRLNSAVLDVKNIEKEFEELLQDDGSEDIVSEYNVHEANREKYTALRDIARRKKEQASAGLARVLAEQAKLSKGQVDASVELGADVWNALCTLTASTKKFVFSELVGDLELSANQIFSEMTARNKSITGRLSLNIVSEEKVIAEIVDGEGVVLRGTNDSNIILVKLSLMMAILKSRELWSQNFTMVTDAPTSKMATEYSQGFYEALGKNFTQSIVMTYDFLNKEDLSRLSDLNIGKVYSIEALYPNGNRDDRTDLSVGIHEVVL